jgi:hypothetical protein
MPNPSDFLKIDNEITGFINGIFSIIFEALYLLKLGLYIGLNLEAEIQIINSIYLLLPCLAKLPKRPRRQKPVPQKGT